MAPARQYGAGIGAHPGYPDREGFGRNRRLRAGTTLVFGTAIDGARCYLAAGGGIDAEEVPGSASADPVAYMGPSDDGPLDAGEPIAVRPGGSTEVRRWPTGGASSGIAKGRGPVELAIVEGPHLDRFPAGVREAPAERRWTVSARADRTGADWLRRTAAMLA